MHIKPAWGLDLDFSAALALVWLRGVGAHVSAGTVGWGACGPLGAGRHRASRGLPARDGCGDSSPEWTGGLGLLKTEQTESLAEVITSCIRNGGLPCRP